MPRRSLTQAAGLAAATLALVGCGSSSHSAPPPPGTAAPAPAATTTPATVTPATVAPATTSTVPATASTAPTSPAPATAAPTTTTAPVVAPTTTVSTPVAAAATCTTAQLSVSLQSPLGSAGAEHYQFVFRNSSALACALYGYPGVSFLNSTGGQIGPPAVRGTSVAPSRVTLAPGAAGYVRLDVTDPGIPPCAGPGTVWRVRVYPPDSTSYTLVAPPGTMVVCSSANTSTYTASAVGPVSATPTQ